MTPDAEAESLAAALSYLDDMPMLLESPALLLDAGGWLGGKLPPAPPAASDQDDDPSDLLETLSTSSLLDISLVEAAGIAPPSPVRLSPRVGDAQPAGEAPQQSLVLAPPSSRLHQLRQQTVEDQAKATHNRMVVPSAPMSRALTKKAPGKKPLNYNPNRARDERRQELIYLRQKVKEMEEQLQLIHANQGSGAKSAALPMRLGQKRSLSTAAEPSYDRSTIIRSACTGNIKAQKTHHSSETSSSPQFVVPKVWQDMCARQLEQRIKAERENIRLKLILEGQIKIAKSMEKLLKKRETLRAMETCGSKGTKRVHLPPTNAEADTSIYDELLAGVETSYKEVDAVFEANGLDHMETSHRDAQVRDGVNGMYLEVFANKVLPFDMRTTGEAVWQHFKGTEHNATRLARSYYSKTSEDFATTQDTMVERFGLEMHANNSRADFHVKQILRRYVEKDRVVIVWRSRIEPLEFSNKPLSGINFTEKGYVVVKPPSTMSQDFTLLQTCYIITPDLSDKSLNEDAQAGALTEFVLSSTAANITASHEMIENVLLDQALKKRPHV